MQKVSNSSPYLLVCDHAGRLVPERLGDLGLPAAEFDRHIAWDIGALALAQALGERLGATVVSQRYSRLVIDCNREPSRADAIPEVSDGAPIPANVGLSAADRAARVAALHTPYHAAIDAELDEGGQGAIVCMHSFTPALRGGAQRPWQCGVLHEGNSALSHAMLARLRGEANLCVGDNEPYRMDDIDYTAPRHGIGRGIQYLELEVRQDLIAHADGVAAWADRLARLLPLAWSDLGG